MSAMYKTLLSVTAIIFVLHLSACGTECGEGTIERGGECVSGETIPCGPGTESINGTCRPSNAMGGGECGPGTFNQGGLCVPELQAPGNAIRMLAPTLSTPTGLAEVANPVLLDSFASGESQNFLALYQPSQGVLKIYGGTGVAEADGTYTLDLTTSYEVNASDSFTTDPFTLALDALGGNPIVLQETVITGTIAEQGGTQIITGGTVTGILLETDAMNVFIDLAQQDLATLLTSLADPQDETGGWRFTFTFEAQPIWMF